MSSVFSNNSPILITYRKGNDVDPYVQYSHDVVVGDEGVAILIEIPNEFTHVRIDGMYEKQMDYYNKDSIKENEYVVDYRMGFVYFNPIMKGETVRVEYNGIGVVLYPASRIYNTNKKDVITTIQEEIDTSIQNEQTRQSNFEASQVTMQSTFETNESNRKATFEGNETVRSNNFNVNETKRQDIFSANELSRQSIITQFQDWYNTSNLTGKLPFIIDGGDYGDTNEGSIYDGGDY